METESRIIRLLITFSINGNLRFLSHAETMRLWQRVLGRSGIRVVHSCGFNPRPKISLPLPRSVGVETDCDMLCAEIDEKPDLTVLVANLKEQLPDGCKIKEISAAAEKRKLHPAVAAYSFEIDGGGVQAVRSRAENVLASEKLTVERVAPKGKRRRVEVRQFIENIEINENNVTVLCKISGTGAIRIEEMLNLLGVRQEQLASPVRRSRIVWN